MVKLKLNLFSVTLVLYLVLINFCYCYRADYNEGDNCKMNGTVGICTLFEDCEYLSTAVSSGLLDLNELKKVVCLYKLSNKIYVCCSENKSSGTTTFQAPIPITTTKSTGPRITEENQLRPAAKACKDIKENFGEPITTEKKIINGRDAEYGEFPHIVALGYNRGKSIEYSCGGTLISDRFVLTAGHCMKKSSDLPIRARMGTVHVDHPNDVLENPLDMQIINHILHPNYSGYYNDIGLLELEKPINFALYNKTIHPACLYTDESEIPEGTNLTIAGWGLSNFTTHERKTHLQKAYVQLVGNNKCKADEDLRQLRELSAHGIVKTHLCATSGTSDACDGDSGGPIHITNETYTVATVVGVVSFGAGCKSGVPSIYAKVSSNILLDFIESKVWPST